ncbi:MAG: CPBP family intramembrane metalloprotease [Lachnospiraceae bacterium]|nr:CPBP family intramembrane metalloprotease [Lachnospiraceae bacterium]
MKDLKTNRIIQIVYPLFLYYVIYDLANVIFRGFFAEKFGNLFCLLLAACITIPFLLQVYLRLPIVRMDFSFKKETMKRDIFLVLLVVVVGILLNMIASHLPLQEISEGYQRANETLWDGNLIVKILCNAIAVPILEELLFRGIVCNQLSFWFKPWVGILISSILFGIMHFNVIQFLYAFIVGLILGVSYIKTHNLVIPILGHGLTNLIVILYFM